MNTYLGFRAVRIQTDVGCNLEKNTKVFKFENGN